MAKFRRKGGLIKTIILILIAIIILSFFGFDIKDIIEAPQTQKNLDYVFGFVKVVWDEYLSVPLLYFWHNIFVEVFWEAFIDNIERLKRGEPDDFQTNAPTVK